MNPKEYRIGNYYFNINRVMVVSGITPDNVYFEGDGKPIGAGSPIPLTEEWLLKFGFEEQFIEENKYYSKDVFNFNLFVLMPRLTGGYEVSLNYGGTFSAERTQLYVHQLQNLYFELIGEELTLKD